MRIIKFFLLTVIFLSSYGSTGQKIKSHPLYPKFEEGVNIIAKGEFDQAIFTFHQIIEGARDSELYARILSRISECYWRLGKLDSALAYGNQSREFSDDYPIAKSLAYFNLGIIYIIQGKFERSIEDLNEAKLVLEGHIDDSDIYQLELLANIDQVLGTALKNLGRNTEAIELVKKANEIKSELFGENDPKLITGYLEISGMYKLLGKYEEALNYISIAIDVSQLADYKYAEMYHLAGEIYSLNGQNYLALEFLNKALVYNKANRHTDNPLEANILESTGIVLTRLDRLDEAIVNLKKSLYIRREILGNDHLSIAQSLKNIGVAYSHLNLLDSAFLYLEEAKQLEVSKKIPGQYLMYTLASLGDLYRTTGDLEKAKKHYSEAIKIAHDTYGQKHSSIANFLNNLVEIFLMKNEIDKAIETTQAAMIANVNAFNSKNIASFPSIESHSNPLVLINSLILKGHALYKRYILTDDKTLLDLSKKSYRQGIKLFDSSMKSFSNKDDLVALSIGINEAFESLLLLENDKKQLYNYVEHSKNSVLRLNTLDKKAKLKIPEKLLNKEDSLKKLISEMKSMSGNVFSEELFDYQRSYDSLVNFYEQQFPAYFNLKYKNTIEDLIEVQSNLSKNQLLLEYFQADTILYLLTIDKKSIEAIEIPLDSTLDNQIDAFNMLFRERSGASNTQEFKNECLSLGQELYKKLVAPALRKIDSDEVDKLIIIPDGHLSYLPFEMLLTSSTEKEEKNYKDLSYLIKDYSIQYAYSATLLFGDLYQKNSNPEKGILAIAPNYANKSLDSLNRLALGKFRDELLPLKWNKIESSKLSENYNADALIGQEAIEQGFKAKAKDYKVLHLAMHAFVDDQDPMNSKLAFSQNTDSTEDGYLHAFEIFSMNLNAELAVLSACNSNYGKLERGEGIASLGRAFAYAGVPALLTTHWKIDDEVSSELMLLFYKYLEDGLSKSESLRQAKLEYLANSTPLKANPFYWGSFVLIGKDDPVELGTSWYTSYKLWTGITITFLAVLLLLLRRRNAQVN